MHAYQITDQTTKIVVAYVSNNSIASNQIKALIDCVYLSLSHLSAGSKVIHQSYERKTKKQVRDSQKYEWLISFIDGQPYKSLKRHLHAHGLTPEIYRTRYGLPPDYPMISAAYAAQRSQIAKRIQFGYKAK